MQVLLALRKLAPIPPLVLDKETGSSSAVFHLTLIQYSNFPPEFAPYYSPIKWLIYFGGIVIIKNKQTNKASQLLLPNKCYLLLIETEIDEILWM